jgi:hypothetical protein
LDELVREEMVEPRIIQAMVVQRKMKEMAAIRRITRIPPEQCVDRELAGVNPAAAW